ncbi:hypothetical protein BOX15_Mlig012233g1, partial [Macrostomum lignano]
SEALIQAAKMTMQSRTSTITSTTTSGHLKWDPKNLEIRTKSVERTLEPLVTQVTTLINFRAPSNRRKGRSKRAMVLVAAVQQATEDFIRKGQEIADENPDVRAEMLTAIEDVRRTGDDMYAASSEFAGEPCSASRRATMVRAARALLSAVTRLLILADMVDVYLLLRSLRIVETDLEHLRETSNQSDLTRCFESYGDHTVELNERACRRQVDLIDPRRRDEIAAARATLMRINPMLLTASKVYIRHPDLGSAVENRDFAFQQVADAINIISGATQATGSSEPLEYEGPGELAAALEEFEKKVLIDPHEYVESRVRPFLEERLEHIISGAALLADSPCTRPDRRDRIVGQCQSVRQALQDLLSELGRSAGRPDRSQALNESVRSLLNGTDRLRHELRQAVVDHVSDNYLGVEGPLDMILNAAREGKEAQVEALAILFHEHVTKLTEVGQLACSMSSEDSVKLVRKAAGQVDLISAEVLNAARSLSLRPQSRVAQENLEVFVGAWRDAIDLLTLAVDEITNIEDFLAVSEGHIWEDVQMCLQAASESKPGEVHKSAHSIRGRSGRVCDVVVAEMASYEPGPYVDRVNEAVTVLRDRVIPHFADTTDNCVNSMSNRGGRYNEAELRDVANRVYESVRDVRRAVVHRVDESQFPGSYGSRDRLGGMFDTLRHASTGSGAAQDHGQENVIEEVDDENNQRRLMAMLPAQERERISEEINHFIEERQKLLRETVKWDDSANEIVVLAKQMCLIMMEMTDFTRGRGPLKSTMDVIKAAKRISDCGQKLDKLAKAVADECPDSNTKNDLLAYLQRITLYCHQLNITSNVKVNVQSAAGGELIVSGLDSATSLIQAAKNLIIAVVLVVKASYIASTQYKRGPGQRAVVQWRMRAPGKKQLYSPAVQDDFGVIGGGPDGGLMRHGSHGQDTSQPLRELADFDQGQDETFA